MESVAWLPGCHRRAQNRDVELQTLDPNLLLLCKVHVFCTLVGVVRGVWYVGQRLDQPRSQLSVRSWGMDPSQSGAPSHLLGNLECSSQVHHPATRDGADTRSSWAGPHHARGCLGGGGQYHQPAFLRACHRQAVSRALGPETLDRSSDQTSPGTRKASRLHCAPPGKLVSRRLQRLRLIQVGAANGLSRKVIFRCPMPHKLAEQRYPGSIDEKLSYEVGAHIWVEENRPEIRSPHLFGFGFSDGRQVSNSLLSHS